MVEDVDKWNTWSCDVVGWHDAMDKLIGKQVNVSQNPEEKKKETEGGEEEKKEGDGDQTLDA